LSSSCPFSRGDFRYFQQIAQDSSRSVRESVNNREIQFDGGEITLTGAKIPNFPSPFIFRHFCD
jgi:hypothetical protein